MKLEGRTIVLGVSGGIAAYKAPEIVRAFRQLGARVRVVMTEAASHFIGAATFQAITGEPVWSDLWDARMPNGMAHIDLTRDAQLLLQFVGAAVLHDRGRAGVVDGRAGRVRAGRRRSAPCG